MAKGKILGIGGIFLRSRDAQRLAAWYRKHLGIVVSAAGEPDPEGGWAWPVKGGDCVFSVFHDDSDYFPADRQVMLNLKVEGLDALAERLEAEGVRVERRDEWEIPQLGSFARIHDCDGNPIELWEAAEKRPGD